MKNLLKLGSVLNKAEQQSINGGKMAQGFCSSHSQTCNHLADCDGCEGCFWHPNGQYRYCA